MYTHTRFVVPKACAFSRLSRSRENHAYTGNAIRRLRTRSFDQVLIYTHTLYTPSHTPTRARLAAANSFNKNFSKSNRPEPADLGRRRSTRLVNRQQVLRRGFIFKCKIDFKREQIVFQGTTGFNRWRNVIKIDFTGATQGITNVFLRTKQIKSLFHSEMLQSRGLSTANLCFLTGANEI